MCDLSYQLIDNARAAGIKPDWFDLYEFSDSKVSNECFVSNMSETIGSDMINEELINSHLMEKKQLQNKILQQQCIFEEENYAWEKKYNTLAENFNALKKREQNWKIETQDREDELVDQMEENERLRERISNEQSNKTELLKNIKDRDDEIKKLANYVEELINELRDKELLKKDLMKAQKINNKLLPCNDEFEREIKSLKKELNILVKEKKIMIDSVRQIVHNSSEIDQDLTSFDNDSLVGQTGEKNKCLILGCNGKGHINGKSSKHRT